MTPAQFADIFRSAAGTAPPESVTRRVLLSLAEGCDQLAAGHRPTKPELLPEEFEALAPLPLRTMTGALQNEPGTSTADWQEWLSGQAAEPDPAVILQWLASRTDGALGIAARTLSRTEREVILAAFGVSLDALPDRETVKLALIPPTAAAIRPVRVTAAPAGTALLEIPPGWKLLQVLSWVPSGNRVMCVLEPDHADLPY